MQLDIRRAFGKKTSYLIPALALATASFCQADTLYFQGFESNTNGWNMDAGGDGNGSITRTASGGGSLGLTAPDGSYYAEVHNNTNAYQLGYGTGGNSLFGGVNAAPGTPFTQSIDLYLNVGTPAPTNAATAAFWIDMSPGSNDGTPGYNAEHDFAFFYNGSSVMVDADDSSSHPLATISTSGWYKFSMTYTPGANSSDPVNTTLAITTTSNAPVGATYSTSSDPNGTLMSSEVSGPGYVWLPVWQNGFSSDLLGIDDVQANGVSLSSVPEPASLALLGVGLLGLAFLRRKFHTKNL